MASTVGARTHYEILGLKPTATADEIERAFAGQIGGFRPHSISGLAEVTVAHETLRDPAKRRDYDASIGLVGKQKPKQLLAWSGVGHASFGGSAFASHAPGPAEPVVAVRPPPPEPSPPTAAQTDQETPFIAAALRELARPEPLNGAARVPWPQSDLPRLPQSEAALDPPMPLRSDLRPALDEQLRDAEGASIPWKRTGIIAGALLVGVVLVGTWAGWNAGDSTEGKAAVKVALPPSTTFTVADPAAVASDPVVEQARPAQPKRPALARARAAHPRPAPHLAELERQISELPQTAPGTPQTTAVDAVAEAAPGTAVAASMPLPNGVIARTIQRIGYPCGQVASTAPGGSAGAFTVTCTSGHSYHAAPVHGRYRFRRAGGR